MSRAAYPDGSIEERILTNARLSRGRMPISILVADAAELAAARAFAKGRQNCGKLGFELKADSDSRLAALRDRIAGRSGPRAAEAA